MMVFSATRKSLTTPSGQFLIAVVFGLIEMSTIPVVIVMEFLVTKLLQFIDHYGVINSFIICSS